MAGVRGIEPEHYEIEAILAERDLALDVRALLTLRATVDGFRTVAFEMKADLRPERVVDGDGREVEWFRSRNELVAVLP